MGNDIYEIKNCVRSSNISSMVERMIDTMREAIEELETIDLDVEWVTKEDDEE